MAKKRKSSRRKKKNNPVGEIVATGVTLGVGSGVVGGIAGAFPGSANVARIANTTQSGLAVASTGQIVKGASVPLKGLKELTDL
jgi:hypothetical protein